MSRLPLLLGGSALAAYLWSRSRTHTSNPSPSTLASTFTGRWVWPVQNYNGRPVVVSDGFNSPRPGVPRHGGVDLMFKRNAADAFKPGTSNGTKAFVMPDDIAVVAASDGAVWSAMKTSRGNAIVIEHGPRKVATFYTHLDKLLVTPTSRGQSKQRVRAGDILGTVGFSPLDGEKIKHLHFEVWLGNPSDAIDPELVMKTWEHVGDPRTALVARNGSLTYRPVGESGAYPQWVRDLKGEAGVYLIRDTESHELLYVGSSAGRLYDTLTRHFQAWRRFKGFWRGQYAEGHDPGLTYDRGDVEVAIRLTKPDDSLDEESRLIHRLRPRDNLIGQPADDEAVPF